jgi:hypothetical protein
MPAWPRSIFEEIERVLQSDPDVDLVELRIGQVPVIENLSTFVSKRVNPPFRPNMLSADRHKASRPFR